MRVILKMVSALLFELILCLGNYCLAETINEKTISINSALSYLIVSQNGDGSWGSAEEEKIRTTSMVLNALESCGVSGLVYQRGINWLVNADAQIVDDLARQIIQLAPHGLTTNKQHQQLLESGLETESGLVWGAYNDHNYSALDTILALKALDSIGAHDENSFNSLMSLQKSAAVDTDQGRGWSYNDFQYIEQGVSHVVPTAQLLLMLQSKASSQLFTAKSDQFDVDGLDGKWNISDPVGDGSVVVENGSVELTVAAGVAHDVWKTTIDGLSIDQPITAIDFESKVKFDTIPSLPYQKQGLLLVQDADTYLRLALLHDGSKVRLSAFAFEGNSYKNKVNKIINAQLPFYMRIQRVDDLFTYSYSNDDVNWTVISTFSWQGYPSKLSVFASNAGTDPAEFTASVDFVEITANEALDTIAPTGFWGQQSDIDAAHWLSLQQQPNGSITDGVDGGAIETALAVYALGVAKELPNAVAQVQSAYDFGVEYLYGKQESNGSLGDDAFKTALFVRALQPGYLVQLDSDGDGIPNLVEVQLGTDPDLQDTEVFERGNGNNYHVSSSGDLYLELLLNETVLLQIDSGPGSMTIEEGGLPQGVSLNSANRTLTGTPSSLGEFGFNYSVIEQNGSKRIGVVLLSVVDSNSDTDGDGMPAYYEKSYSGVLDSLDSDDASVDSDLDGLTNFQEFQFGSNPTVADADGDGLNDYEEWLANSNPNMEDTDGDGMPDWWEVQNGLNAAVDDKDLDLDLDGLSNIDEMLAGLWANDPDFDDDGILDGEDSNPFFNQAILIPILHILLG